jgi:hypothetical protein
MLEEYFMIYMSDELGQLAEAHANAQGTFKKLIPNEPSPGGPYANLDAILFAVKDSLKENGLSFLQWTELRDEGNGAELLWSSLTHKSGQFMRSCARLVRGDGSDRANDIRNQTIRRKQASMLLGIAPSSNDPDMVDDDGNSQHHDATMDDLKRMNAGETPAKRANFEVITKAMYDDILIECHGYPEIVVSIMKYFNITTLADLPITEYHRGLAEIRRLKEEYKRYRDRLKKQ